MVVEYVLKIKYVLKIDVCLKSRLYSTLLLTLIAYTNKTMIGIIAK